jgi:hypothetical protein
LLPYNIVLSSLQGFRLTGGMSMEGHQSRAISKACLILAFALILSACGPISSVQPTSKAPEGTYSVDPIFREFYSLLGGEDVLGYAISPSFSFDQVQMQYTENALMRYDPKASSAQQYSLAPLGAELGINDAPIVLPQQSGTRVVDGYVIYDEFLKLYDRMQGARFVGRPLTQVRINSDHDRIEQYFSDIGFYRLLSDPPGKVHLLAYGAWKCDLACRSQPPANAIVSRAPYVAEPMIESLNRLGSDFTGRPLSPPYIAADGELEQIYENIVAFADPSNIRMVHLRPVPSMVGYSPSAPVQAIKDARMRFYPLQGNLGHNVPVVFENYIVMHGGMEMAQAPISEIFADGKVYRQCFTNYCLDFDPAAARALQIRPAPLGSLYLQMIQAKTPAPDLNLTSKNVTLKIQAAKAMISSDQEQEVLLSVVERGSGNPIPNLEAQLDVTLPDGSDNQYHFPPTSEDGRASLVLPAIHVTNGSMIALNACLNSSGGTPACATDSFVIWSNP